MNPNEQIDKYYKTEKDLFYANGGDRDAIKHQYEELRHERMLFLEHIKNITLEFLGREQALKEATLEVNK